MIVLILAVIVSLIPITLLLLWLRKYRKGEEGFKKVFDRSFGRGVLSVLLVVLFSAVFYVLLRLSGLKDSEPLLYEALYTFIVLAFAEEAVKLLTFSRALRKSAWNCSWLDAIVLLAAVAIGFSMIESIIYAIGSSVPVILVRGACLPHVGFAFIVGYSYGKAKRTGKRSELWKGFAFSWFLHGMYDFSLSQEFLAVNDNLAIVALLLAAADLAFGIALIVFVRRHRTDEKYTQPLSGDGGDLPA